MKCNRITVTLSNKGLLSAGKPGIEFDCQNVHVSVLDCIKRKVEISSTTEIDIDVLWRRFGQLHTLCMLGEGYFYDIETIGIDGSISSTQEELDNYAQELLKKQVLPYQRINTDFYGDNIVLTSFRDYITPSIMQNWISTYDELVYPHNAFLYMSNIGGLPLDMRTAYITECFEPLAKYIAEKYGESITKYKGNSITLFDCLKYIVIKYGEVCFARENKVGETDCRIEQLVNNRVRLMHLKKDMGNKKFMSMTDMAVYSRKLHILYRHALLQCLGVDAGIYQNKLEQCIKYWDNNHTYITNCQGGTI